MYYRPQEVVGRLGRGENESAKRGGGRGWGRWKAYFEGPNHICYMPVLPLTAPRE